MLTSTEVAKRVGVARMTLHRWLVAGKFPEAKLINGRRAGWSEETITNWIKENVK